MDFSNEQILLISKLIEAKAAELDSLLRVKLKRTWSGATPWPKADAIREILRMFERGRTMGRERMIMELTKANLWPDIGTIPCPHCDYRALNQKQLDSHLDLAHPETDPGR